MTDYTRLDKLIIDSCSEFGPTNCRRVWGEAGLIAKETGRDQMRVVDGRLQALRKAGKIRHVKASINGRGGWEALP